MKYHIYLFIGTLFSYPAATVFGFLISSQLTINPSAVPSIQTIKQTVDIELEEINTTEYVYLVTPPSLFDFNMNPPKNNRFGKSTGNGAGLNYRKAKTLPRIQDVPFHLNMIPIPHKNLISKPDPSHITSVPQPIKKLDSPSYSHAMDKAKQFANRYLSREEQFELRQVASKAKESGASEDEVRQVISRYLNSVLTPDEKRTIASQVHTLNQEFGDNIFAQQ